MKKKIFFSAAVFLAAFATAFLVFFPLEETAAKRLREVLDKNKIDMAYNTLNVGFFGAKMTRVKARNLEIEDIVLSYNPVGLFLKRISFKASSPLFMAEGKLSGNSLNAKIKGSVGEAAKLMGFAGSGSLNAEINYNRKAASGEIKVSGGPVTFNHPMLAIDSSSVNAEATLKGSILTIEKIEASGKTSLDGKGTVAVNPKKIEYSSLDISGKAGVMGLNLDFRLQGPAAAPRFSLK